MQEIIRYMAPYKKILLIGCNECVTVCAAGGRKEVGLLASALHLNSLKEGRTIDIKEITLERQCDPEYVEELNTYIDNADAVLSMACGCGVQTIAERYKNAHVYPAVTLNLWGHLLARGFGRKDVRDAAIACWESPQGSVQSLDAQKAF